MSGGAILLDRSFGMGIPLGVMRNLGAANVWDVRGRIASGAVQVAAALLAALFALVSCVLPLSAQGAVSGRVALTERPGEQSSDIGNTVIYLVPTAAASARTTPANASIAMNGRTFVPRVRVVTPGSRVDFPNQDPFSHNIFSTTPGAVFDLGLYPSGRSRDTQFRRAGIFPVYCNIHPRMTAFVVVVPSPYFTMAGADGRWTLPNVPAGEYTLHIWHERADETKQPLQVAASGQSGVDVTVDARGFRFAQHKNKFGREYDRTGRDRY
jgi:plastocyanin